MKKKSMALVPIPRAERRDLAPAPPLKPVMSALAGFLSKNTKAAYERDLKDFFEVADLSLIDIKEVIAVTPDRVVAFRDKLATDGMSSATICRKLSALRSMYAYLHAAGLLERNPADPKLVRSPKRSTVRRTSPMTPQELRKLLDQPDRHTEIGQRDYAMLLLASQAGLRREELCQMRDDHLAKYGARWNVTFRGKGGKERRIPLHDSVIAAIDLWKRVRPRNAESLFVAMDGSRCQEGMFYKTLRKYALQAGFDPAVKRIHPHGLRSAFATILYEDGVPLKEIQGLMGHSRAETTMGYIREADLAKTKAPDVMARALEPREEE
jgi:site-specific recombinase XerD